MALLALGIGGRWLVVLAGALILPVGLAGTGVWTIRGDEPDRSPSVDLWDDGFGIASLVALILLVCGAVLTGSEGTAIPLGLLGICGHIVLLQRSIARIARETVVAAAHEARADREAVVWVELRWSGWRRVAGWPPSDDLLGTRLEGDDSDAITWVRPAAVGNFLVRTGSGDVHRPITYWAIRKRSAERPAG